MKSFIEICAILDEEYELVKENYVKVLRLWRKWSSDTSKEIIIWGAGEWGKALYWRLKHLGIHVNYFIDSNDEKVGNEVVDGIFCLSKREVLGTELGDKIFILGVGNESVRKEIGNELLAIGSTNIFDSIMECCNEQIRLWGWSEKWLKIDASVIREYLKDFWNCLEDEESKNIIYQKFRFLLGEKVDFSNICSEYQYFIQKGEYLESHESIVDCGAFTGDTLNELTCIIGYNKFDSYYCFEMDDRNSKILKENVKKYPIDIQNKIHIIHAGVGGKNQICSYSMNETNSRVEKEGIGDKEGKIISLDSFFQNEKVTFIKMDIEGYEKEALEGCKKIIQEQRPQLAISIYHKVEDIWEIPRYIKSIMPEYKFIVRHHSEDDTETVLYAKIGGFVKENERG